MADWGLIAIGAVLLAYALLLAAGLWLPPGDDR